MTRFMDGPAAGVTLMLRRAPFFLRAVQRPAKPGWSDMGEWDALDQLDDRPSADETIVVYRLRPSTQSRMHVCARGRGARAGGWYEGGEYEVVAQQPDDAVARDTDRWREWAFAHAPADFKSSAPEARP